MVQERQTGSHIHNDGMTATKKEPAQKPMILYNDFIGRRQCDAAATRFLAIYKGEIITQAGKTLTQIQQ